VKDKVHAGNTHNDFGVISLRRMESEIRFALGRGFEFPVCAVNDSRQTLISYSPGGAPWMRNSPTPFWSSVPSRACGETSLCLESSVVMLKGESIRPIMSCACAGFWIGRILAYGWRNQKRTARHGKAEKQ
jgi:hypothetical protein